MHPSFPDSNGVEYETFSESADFLRSEFFMDPDEEGDELRNELVESNAASSRIDSSVDRNQSQPAFYLTEIQNLIPLVTSTALALCGEISIRIWTIQMSFYHTS